MCTACIVQVIVTFMLCAKIFLVIVPPDLSLYHNDLLYVCNIVQPDFHWPDLLAMFQTAIIIDNNLFLCHTPVLHGGQVGSCVINIGV